MTGNGSGLTGVANTDVIFTDKISLGDNGRVNLGIGSDLTLFHDSNRSAINNATGELRLVSGSDIIIGKRSGTDSSYAEIIAAFKPDGACELYHDGGAKKLETDASGVTVTGRVAATSYTGDGSSLTGISVGIATTAASMTGITTVLDLSKDDFKVTASGITTVDVRGGTEGGSHMLRIVNSGITTVGFSTYFLFPSGGTPALPTTDGAISLISFTVHRQGAVGLATQLLAGSSVNFS
tara:strand:- start:13 stop:726 length:714 start_codon:yes stop_codon:yes gene_type:complete